MIKLIEEKNLFERAFPYYLNNNSNKIISNIKLISSHKSFGEYSVIVDEQMIIIPCRIYYEEFKNDEITGISEIEKIILYCFFTRHHNGYIRESMLNHIITRQEKWVIPYIIILISEYIIEILNIIYANIEIINKTYCMEFLKNNKSFFELTKSRIISYWNCYYRNEFPVYNEYVGFKIISYLENLLKM